LSKSIGIGFLMIIFLAGAGAITGGCGEDDSAGSETIETSSLTKAQFVKRADEICSKGTEKALEKILAYVEENESSSKSEPELVAEAIHVTVLPQLEDQFDEIEGLGAPKGDEQEVEALLAAMRSAIAVIEKRRELSLQTNIAPDFRHAGRLSRQYGIEGCAYG
jgi:hypothetical protein